MNEAPFKYFTLGQAPGLIQKHDYAGNTCQGQTLQLITQIRKLRAKTFFERRPLWPIL